MKINRQHDSTFALSGRQSEQRILKHFKLE